MRFNDLSSDDIRQQNLQISKTSRKFCATIGALWYQIDKRKLWEEWGYSSLSNCITEEGPRAYTTILECIANYTYFVIESHLEWEEFEQIVAENGIRKTSMIRRSAKISMPVNVEIIDGSPAPVLVAVPTDTKLSTIREVTASMNKVSVREAWEMVNFNAKEKGIEIQQSIGRKYYFSPDQDEMVRGAIEHIKKRAQGTMSDSQALSLLAGEYLAVNGTRKIAA